jgi:hypothetical protein
MRVKRNNKETRKRNLDREAKKGQVGTRESPVLEFLNNLWGLGTE